METNWAGNYVYEAECIERPRSVGEVQELVAAAAPDAPIRALGTGHSFTGIGDPGARGTLVSVAGLSSTVSIDSASSTARVPAGMRYGDVARELQREGWALRNLASLPHISVAGAVATATHGSGAGNPNLSSAVAGLRFVDGTGELVTLRRGDPAFDGAVVALGALGIVVDLELDIVPSFDVAQTVALGLPWDEVPAALRSAYSVSVFTDWAGSRADQLWVKAIAGTGDPVRPSDDLDLFGALAAKAPVHMIPSADPGACTEQGGVAGPWHERLPHFRLGFAPSAGEEIQSEFLFPRRHTPEAIEAMRGLAHRLAPLLFVSELRTVAPDTLWLSTAYSSGDDDWSEGATAFHFTWRRDQRAVEALLPAVQDALAPFGARPHWGKLFLGGASGAVALYPRFAGFRELVDRYDPDRVLSGWVH